MYTQKSNVSDVVQYELHPRYSRKKVLVLAVLAASVGLVLGQVTATGIYVPLDLTAEDGSEDAKAVLLDNLQASDDEQGATILRRGAGVDIDELIWPDGITTEQKTAALAQLDTLGIEAVDTL